MRWTIPSVFPIQPKCDLTFFVTLCWDQKCCLSVSLLHLKARNKAKPYLQQWKPFILALIPLSKQNFIYIWKCTEHHLGNHSIPQLAVNCHIDSNCTFPIHTFWRSFFHSLIVENPHFLLLRIAAVRSQWSRSIRHFTRVVIFTFTLWDWIWKDNRSL